MAHVARLVVGATVGAALLSAARPIPRATASALRTDAAVAAQSKGISFTYRVTSTHPDKRQREARNMLTNVKLMDGNLRMDYVEGTTPLGERGGYMLILGETGQMMLVNDKDKKAIIIPAEAAGSGLGAMMNNPMLKITMSNQSFRFTDMGAGETMMGYKTRRVRTYYNYTLETKVLMMNNSNTVSDSTDQWIATGLGMDQKSLERWSKSFASGVKSTNPALADAMEKYSAEYGRTGLALKSINWSSQTDKKGKVTSDTVTMEVTELTTGALDPALFKVPANYNVTDLSKIMSGGK